MLYKRVLQEASTRKIKNIEEVINLITTSKNIIKKKNISYQTIYTQAKKDILDDIKKTLQINHHIGVAKQNGESVNEALLYNKNFELLSGTYEFIDNYTYYLSSNKLIDDLNKEAISIDRNIFKNFDSYLNYIKIFYFSILYIVFNYNNKELFEFLNNNKLFDVNISPNIQSTLLPQNFINLDLEFNILEWKYFYKDNLSPAQGELLYFTNGYSFGGSNQDIRYREKNLRSEDCMTSILKWIDAEKDFSNEELAEFSTLDLEKFYDTYNSVQKSKYYKILHNYLLPIKSFQEVSIGDIFAYREYDIQQNPDKTNHQHSLAGHTGVITSIDTDMKDFIHLSYSRHIPMEEGLIYTKENMKEYPQKKYFFFKYKRYLSNKK
ncbi:MAG: hypothetical protein ACI8ZF_000584 [Candidatus Midichloriaceae bacterium]|jgi:hypothetical protein